MTAEETGLSFIGSRRLSPVWATPIVVLDAPDLSIQRNVIRIQVVRAGSRQSGSIARADATPPMSSAELVEDRNHLALRALANP